MQFPSPLETGNMGKHMAELALSAKLKNLDTRTYGTECMGTRYTIVTETPTLVGCDRALHGVPKALNEEPTTPNSCTLGPRGSTLLWSTKDSVVQATSPRALSCMEPALLSAIYPGQARQGGEMSGH